MAENKELQMIENPANDFRGYAILLRNIKQRIWAAQRRAIYAANEEMLRMYWDIGEMLQKAKKPMAGARKPYSDWP